MCALGLACPGDPGSHLGGHLGGHSGSLLGTPDFHHLGGVSFDVVKIPILETIRALFFDLGLRGLFGGPLGGPKGYGGHRPSKYFLKSGGLGAAH